MLTGTATKEIPPETKNRTMIWFSNSISGYISKENENTDLKHVHEIINPTHEIIAPLFTVIQDRQATQVSINKWMGKENVMHAHTQWNITQPLKVKFLSLEATSMDLEAIMLCEISQRKTNTECYYLYMESKK